MRNLAIVLILAIAFNQCLFAEETVAVDYFGVCQQAEVGNYKCYIFVQQGFGNSFIYDKASPGDLKKDYCVVMFKNGKVHKKYFLNDFNLAQKKLEDYLMEKGKKRKWNKNRKYFENIVKPELEDL